MNTRMHLRHRPSTRGLCQASGSTVPNSGWSQREQCMGARSSRIPSISLSGSGSRAYISLGRDWYPAAPFWLPARGRWRACVASNGPKNLLLHFVWWPVSHPESQKAQVDWLCARSFVLSPLIHMVGLPHSTIDITTISPLVDAGKRPKWPRRATTCRR
jgi:hypothetical protein